MIRIDILTIFPEFFSDPLDKGIIGRVRSDGRADIRLCNIRDFADDRRRTVDGTPCGGGSGMVFRPEPIARALHQLQTEAPPISNLIYLTPQGERLTQPLVNRLSMRERLVLLCGRYKGIDQRVIDRYVTDEISIGDYVLSGGEPAALVLVDAVVRLLPGALGDAQSALADSFQDGLLDSPWYTRPRVFEGMEVPEILFSGDHARIARWRRDEALRRTRERRPDLLDGLSETESEENAEYDVKKDSAQS